MASLKSTDFKKPASSGPYAGENRENIFSLKIKDKKKFFIGENERSGKEVTGTKYDKKTKKFYYYEGTRKSAVKEVPYTKVFKDKDFGGGAGSGGGAEDTKYTESMQCYYSSYVFNVKKGKIKSAPDTGLKKAAKWVVADASLDQCWKNGPKDWIESDVYIKTANKLYDAYGRKMRGNVHFHRGSPFMNNIYKAKAEVHKIDKKSTKPQAPGSFSNDKWNPGDIWASTFRPSEQPLKDYTTNWGELNHAVYNFATKGNLLGISLKKIGANQQQAKLAEFNSPKQQAKRDAYKYNGFTYGKTGDFFQSQDIYVSVDVGDVQFRTFGGEISWQGEIKGGAAAGGKIGGGNIDFFCKQVFGQGIYGNYDNERGLLGWVRSNQDGEYQERLYELYKKYNSKSRPSKTILKEDEFYYQLATKDFKFKNSKIICMEFLDVLQSGSKAKQNDFSTLMFRYAQSDVDQSSYFIKLY